MTSPFKLNSTISQILCSAQWRRPFQAKSRALALGVGSTAALALGALSISAVAQIAGVPAGQPPSYGGVWIDHSSDGAVEIVPCGDKLCGRIVWLKAPVDKAGKPLIDANNSDARQRQRPICGLPVIGNLKRQQDGVWDEGWIYDPKQGKQFDVELKLRTADTLQVTGYLGVKFLSETFMWKRAPLDLKRCA